MSKLADRTQLVLLEKDKTCSETSCVKPARTQPRTTARGSRPGPADHAAIANGVHPRGNRPAAAGNFGAAAGGGRGSAIARERSG
jgi:hypothetical protein